MAKCSICESSHLKAIDDDIRNEVTGVEISKKYGVHQMAISRHKRHMMRDNLEDIREILNEGVDRKSIKISNAADYIRLLEFEEKQKTARCEVCQYRMDAENPKRTIEQALSEFIGNTEEDNICVTKEQYEAFQRWIESLPESDPARVQHMVWADQRKAWCGSDVPSSKIIDDKKPPTKINEIYKKEKK